MAIPVYTPQSCWTISHFTLVDVLADTTAVRAFLGVGSAGQAKAGNMFLHTLGRAVEEYSPAEWPALFPNIIIGSPSEPDVYKVNNVATGPSNRATGKIDIQLSKVINPDTAEDVQELQFQDQVGLIIEELMADGRLDMPEISVQVWNRAKPPNQTAIGLLHYCRFQFPWGTAGVGED